MVFRPDEEQMAILRVVLATTDEAVVSRFAAWTAISHIDELRPGVHGLLPAAYRNAEAAGVSHDWMGRLGGVYRRHWTAGELARSATNDAVASLEEAGIEAIRPPDQQLAALLADPATFGLGRPRITVRWEECDVALRALDDCGWTRERRDDRGSSLRRRLTWIAQTVERSDGARIEVAGTFNSRLVGAHRDAELWRRAEAAASTRGLVATGDLLVAALCDQLDIDGALRWTLPARSLIEAQPGGFDVGRIVDFPAARTLLPMLAARAAFLTTQFSGDAYASLAAELSVLADKHAPRPGWPGTLLDAAGRRQRAAQRFPSAVREIVDRHGGLRGTVAASRGRAISVRR